MSSIYTLASNYNGQQHSVLFYPAGYGASYDGYVTSIDQFKEELKENYDENSFKLMYISGSSEMKEIEDDHDLFKAVRKLKNGAHLFVTLSEVENDESSDYEQWNVDASDSEEESDSEDDGKYENDLDDTLARFVHQVGECHHCGGSDGLRYQYSMNSGYRMCGECWADLGKREKKSWPLAELPWEDDVPPYPLYREEGSPIREENTHLQYLLTRIGFMPLSATDSLTGSFQGNTERAVAKFRKEYNIQGEDMTIYNKKMARKLAQVVRNLRSQGQKYL